jgi:LDH2 family malate/lactate/ureidoglycolate dehydrogenase
METNKPDLVDFGALRDFIACALHRVGLSAADADKVAGLMAQTDLQGSDGDNGMGHLVVSHAVAVAIDKARTAGVAWVGVRGSNHAGPASLYARMPIEHDMIGLYFAVGNANHLPPWADPGQRHKAE